MIISSNIENEIIINKSRFITYIYKIKNKTDFLIIYNNLKKKYKDATHICYAYIINNEIKCDDDKEPSGSAGLPILEVLRKNNLNYTVCFVIRYFGGIKLGAAGLIRAYSNSASLCLKKTTIKKIEKLYKIELTIDYSDINSLENIIKSGNILKKSFKDNITYIILVNEEEKEKLDNYNFIYNLIDDNYF